MGDINIGTGLELKIMSFDNFVRFEVLQGHGAAGVWKALEHTWLKHRQQGCV